VFSSFIKRRLDMAPHSMAPLLDQVPESLLPALMLRHTFGMDAVSIIILVAAFVVAELLLSLVLFKLGIRKKPY
jgi:CDP-2,3-bis-(O-geranylgeranyl)-sn-glycerol synthase